MLYGPTAVHDPVPYILISSTWNGRPQKNSVTCLRHNSCAARGFLFLDRGVAWIVKLLAAAYSTTTAGHAAVPGQDTIRPLAEGCKNFEAALVRPETERPIGSTLSRLRTLGELDTNSDFLSLSLSLCVSPCRFCDLL